MHHAAIAIIIAILAGGTVTVAAEGAAPGNPLYGLKVGVTEEIRAGLSFSAEAKARWETERARRRLEEAERISARATLSADVREMLEANFERHADAVEARIEDLETTDLRAAADISAGLESSLEAHQTILAMLSARETDAREKAEVERIHAAVDAEERDAEALRIRVEERIRTAVGPEVKAAAEGRLVAAENKIREVRALIARRAASASAEAILRAQARVSAAEAAVATGKTQLAAQAYGAAFMSFSAAHRIAQEAQMILEARMILQIDIDGGADVDVPDDRRSPTATEAEAQMEAEINAGSGGVQGGVDLETDVGL